MRFDASSFAVAGVIASLVPIVIHLVNRRHYKTVEWAAMSFLREAMERNRRVLHLRDLLLLAVRMLAVLLFGLLLARPFLRRGAAESIWQVGWLLAGLTGTVGFAVMWATSKAPRSRTSATGFLISLLTTGYALSSMGQHPTTEASTTSNSRLPVHAVLLIDNSRSLGVEAAGGTLFDRARAIASSFIAALPLGSRITVIPFAGSEEVTTLDAYHSKADAQHALDRLKLVDTEGNLRTGFELAERASQQTTSPAEKRVVLLTDAQANAWQGFSQAELKRLAGWQIVNVTKSPARNLWVSHFRAEEGIASTESPCRFHARLHSLSALPTETQPPDEPFEVQVELSIDGTEVASKTLTLSAGQDREVEFAYQFEGSPDPLQPRWSIAVLTVRADRQSVDQLPGDNRQQIAVPVASSIPIVFIDQYGDREQVDRNQIGETHALRHLMAPRLKNQNSERPLIQIVHLPPDQVTQEKLKTARLVVIGGVEQPDPGLVSVLHDFVEQGGPLVVLAGGQFNPAAWTERAWLDGHGILPVPLDARPLGQTPEEAAQQLKPFFVDFSSIQDDRFVIEGEDPQALSQLFESTPFFKAIRVNLSVVPSTDPPTPAQKTPEPTWWAWRSPLPSIEDSLSPGDLDQRNEPRILASFDTHHEPFAIERRIGAGRVLLFTSGVSSNWNLLRSSGAMYLFHRTFFQLIDRTFPPRTFEAGERIVLPVERRRDRVYSVTRPSGEKESLPLELVQSSLARATIQRSLSAGTYVVASEPLNQGTTDSPLQTSDEQVFAVNGAESESDLAVLNNRELELLIGNDDLRLLAYDEPIGLESGARQGYELGKGLGWCALGCLLFEMGMLAWPTVGQRRWFSPLGFRSKQPL